MNEVTIKHNPAANRFEYQEDGHTAVLEYILKASTIRTTHTIVPPELGGKGLGSALAKAALHYAKEQELQVIPQCSFIASYIEKHPEWQSLLAAQ